MTSIEEKSRKLEHWHRRVLNTRNLARKMSERLLELRQAGLSVSTVEKTVKLFTFYNERNTVTYIYNELFSPLKGMFQEFLDTLSVSEILMSSEDIVRLCDSTNEMMLEAIDMLEDTLLEIEQATSKYRKN